jgi:hypothetical protein
MCNHVSWPSHSRDRIGQVGYLKYMLVLVGCIFVPASTSGRIGYYAATGFYPEPGYFPEATLEVCRSHPTHYYTSDTFPIAEFPVPAMLLLVLYNLEKFP